MFFRGAAAEIAADGITATSLYLSLVRTRMSAPTPIFAVVVGLLRYGAEMAKVVPFTGTEKESLQVSLDRHRDVVVWKLAGLTEEQARKPMTPSGTSLLGLVKHLGSVEYGWFCSTFGAESDEIPFDENDPEADMRAEPHESIADLLAYYGRARAAADAVINRSDLAVLGTAWDGRRVSMRWVLIHMIEETARHAGHLDILRELTDGRTGDHPRD